jgi:repressor LexA
MCGIFLPMKETRPLTLKQQKVFGFICQRISENMPPTIREIARELGFSSTGTVRDYLKTLQRKGYLKRIDYKSRGIELAKDIFNRIPILATITAGRPNLAHEDAQGYIEVTNLLPKEDRGRVFALKVKGDSMIEAGIMDGDTAIIRKQEVAHNGDIVAALLENNEATLKIFRQKNNAFFLEAANKDYSAIHKNFSVIGKLITIVRKY